MHLKTKLDELKAEIERVEAQIEKEEKTNALLTEEQRIANQLHSLLCRWNHSDGCGWEWEFTDGKTDWRGYAHESYLGKARRLLHVCKEHNLTPETLIDHYQILKNL